ncbi:MAG TPA: hypothetical protein VI757_00765, partial [Bacteroidia bacterium]|nr:hypothetical protein [Bacteroidia bacterium]
MKIKVEISFLSILLRAKVLGKIRSQLLITLFFFVSAGWNNSKANIWGISSSATENLSNIMAFPGFASTDTISIDLTATLNVDVNGTIGALQANYLSLGGNPTTAFITGSGVLTITNSITLNAGSGGGNKQVILSIASATTINCTSVL